MPAPQKANLAPEALSNSHVLQKFRWENGRGSDRHGAQQMSPSFPFAHLGSVPNAFPTEATGPLSRRSVCSRTKPRSSPRKRLLLVRSACQTVSKHFTQIMSPCKPTTTYAVDTIVLIPVSRKLRLREGRGFWPRCCACCGGARPLPSGVRVNLTSVGPRGEVSIRICTRGNQRKASTSRPFHWVSTVTRHGWGTRQWPMWYQEFPGSWGTCHSDWQSSLQTPAVVTTLTASSPGRG